MKKIAIKAEWDPWQLRYPYGAKILKPNPAPEAVDVPADCKPMIRMTDARGRGQSDGTPAVTYSFKTAEALANFMSHYPDAIPE